MSYAQLTKILENEEVLSSFTQNSSGKTHQWKGIINQDYFDLSESGAKMASLNKIADKIAERFGISESISDAAKAQELEWALFTWNPVRQMLLLGDALFVDVENETDVDITVSCKRKVRGAEKEVDGKRVEPELFMKYTGSSYAEAEHNLAVQVLTSPEYLDRYVTECEMQTLKKTNDFDSLPDLGWSLHEDCDEDGDEGNDDENADNFDYIQQLTDYCEKNELEGPEFKKDLHTRGGNKEFCLCLVRINGLGKTEDEACNKVMENVKKVLKYEGNKEFYECLRPKKEEEKKEENTEESEVKQEEEEEETVETKEEVVEENDDEPEEEEQEADEPAQVSSPKKSKRGRGRGRGRGKK